MSTHALAQDGYPTQNFNGEDDPSVVSPPIILGPLYACADAVGITGLIPGATLEVFINGNLVSTSIPQDIDPAGVSVPSLTIGDLVKARQTLGSFTSDFSDEEEVRDVTSDWPDGLPEPRINPPPLYECGGRTGSFEHLGGARVDFYSRPNSGSVTYTTIGSGTAATSKTHFENITPTFTAGEAITTQYGFCGTLSPMSGDEIVQKAPSQMPAPTLEPLYEGMDVMNVLQLRNGSFVEVFLNGNQVIGNRYTGASSTKVWLSTTLSTGDVVTATQTLCSSSDPSGSSTVNPCKDLPAPIIRTPEIGANKVFVLESLPGARIQVFDSNGEKIGDGGGSEIQLVRTIGASETLYVRQVVGRCVGASYWATDAVCKKVDENEDPSTYGQFNVGRFDYSLGDVSILGTTSRVAAHVRYPVAPNSGSTEVSPWGGEFPLVILLHGNHGIWRNPGLAYNDPYRDVCGDHDTPPDPTYAEVRSHRGYDYLMNSLAQRGYVAVSVDGFDLNCRQDHIEQRAELVLHHLNLWVKIHNTGGIIPEGRMFEGRIDLQDVGLFGHSRGGEAVVRAAELSKTQFDPVLDAKVEGVFSVAPTDFHGHSNSEVPVMVVLPAADGDVWSQHGARTYDRAWSNAHLPWFKSQKYMYGANHNFFNSEWGYDEGLLGPNRLTRSQQEEVARALARAFFDHTLYADGGQRKLMAGDAIINTLPSDIYSSYQHSVVFNVDTHEDGFALTNDLGLGVNPVVFGVFDEFSFSQTGPTYNQSFFQETNGLVARWDSSAAYKSNVSADVSDYPFLSFRITQVNDERNTFYGKVPTTIGIGLIGDDESRVVSSEIGRIPFPYDLSATSYTSKSMIHTLRVPTACLAEMAPEKRIDLEDVKAIKFDTDLRERGALGFDQLSFSK